MDSKVTVGSVKNKIVKFARARGWDPDPRSLAISIALEAGELLEHFQWSQMFKEENKKELEKEFGDVMFYMCEFAKKVDIDISSAVNLTLKRNNEKYPIDGIKKGGDRFYFAQKKKYRKGRR